MTAVAQKKSFFKLLIVVPIEPSVKGFLFNDLLKLVTYLINGINQEQITAIGRNYTFAPIVIFADCLTFGRGSFKIISASLQVTGLTGQVKKYLELIKI